MSKFRRYARYLGDIVVLLGASSVLTVAVLAMGLILAPGPQALLDRILSRNVHNGTVGEVTRCMQRNAEIGQPGFVEPFCRAKHSVSVSGALELDAVCNDPSAVTVTARNGSDDIVFTGFSLRVGEGETVAQIQGQWLEPGAVRDYVVEAPCVPGQAPDPIVALARRGVRAETPEALAAYGLVAERHAELETRPTAAQPSALSQPVQTALLEQAPPQADPPLSQAVARPAAEPLARAAAAPREVMREAPARAAVNTPEAVEPAEPPPEAAPPVAEAAAPPPEAAASAEPAPMPAAQEPVTPTVRLVSSQLALRESDGFARIMLSVTPPAATEAWIQYTVTAESASADGDFAAAPSSRASIEAGAAESAILIPIVNDALVEREETLRVRLERTSGDLVLQGGNEVRVRIVDDD